MTVLPGLRVLVLNASRISARGRTWPITGSTRTSWQSQHTRRGGVRRNQRPPYDPTGEGVLSGVLVGRPRVTAVGGARR